MKHGRRGVPHLRHVWLDAERRCIRWRPPTASMTVAAAAAAPAAAGGLMALPLLNVVPGCATAVFRRQAGHSLPPPEMQRVCFSLIGEARTLDLQAVVTTAAPDVRGGGGSSPQDTLSALEARRDRWLAAFRLLMGRKLVLDGDLT
jgi:hypothetical protein